MMEEVYRDNRLSFVLLAVTWAIFVVSVIVLPDRIPVHWGLDLSSPDRWGSKLELVIVPFMTTVLSLACMGFARVVKGETCGNWRSSEALMNKVTLGITAAMLLLQIGIMALTAMSL